MDYYQELSRRWATGTIRKGWMALRSKRYLRKTGDVFELWNRKDVDGGYVVARVYPNGNAILENIERYDSRYFSVCYDFLHLDIHRVPASVLKRGALNFAHMARTRGTWHPVVNGTVLLGGDVVKTVSPMQATQTPETEKKIRRKIAEWRTLMLTIVALVGKDIKEDWGAYPDAPPIDDEPTGDVALALLEKSRSRTRTRRYYYNYGYKDVPNFEKNLINKALDALRFQWKKTAPDNIWVPTTI